MSVAASYSTRVGGKAPAITMARDGTSCRIRHRELVGSVVGTTVFTVSNPFRLNPGLVASFPWLSTIANSWEQYKFHRLRMIYTTRTATSTPGNFIMAVDYDAADAAPANEQIICAYQDSTADAPWKDNCLEMRPPSLAGGQLRHFIRNAPLPANLDIKTYDCGNFWYATVDGSATGWGRLWIEYDVEFYVPQLPPAGPSPLGGLISGLGVITPANPMGVTPAPDPQTTGFSCNNASVFTFAQAGTYSLSIISVGTVMVSATLTGSASVSGLVVSQAVNAAQTLGVVSALFNTTADNATISLSWAAATITSTTAVLGSAPANSIV